jgi:hypothetical protein
MRPTRELPPHYRRVGGVDLSRQVRLGVVLTLLALLVFAVVSVVLGAVVGAFRDRLPAAGLDLVQLLGVVIVVLLVHEAVHGVCFWMVTRERPRFGLHPLYAYAAAPGWYIPRAPYLVVGVAPLVLLSVVGMLVLLLADNPVVVAVFAAGVSLNAAGSIGDLAIVALVLRHPADTLVLDTGPGVELYGPDVGESLADSRAD